MVEQRPFKALAAGSSPAQPKMSLGPLEHYFPRAKTQIPGSDRERKETHHREPNGSLFIKKRQRWGGVSLARTR
jgi:hypothetical protein